MGKSTTCCHPTTIKPSVPTLRHRTQVSQAVHFYASFLALTTTMGRKEKIWFTCTGRLVIRNAAKNVCSLYQLLNCSFLRITNSLGTNQNRDIMLKDSTGNGSTTIKLKMGLLNPVIMFCYVCSIMFCKAMISNLSEVITQPLPPYPPCKGRWILKKNSSLSPFASKNCFIVYSKCFFLMPKRRLNLSFPSALCLVLFPYCTQASSEVLTVYNYIWEWQEWVKCSWGRLETTWRTRCCWWSCFRPPPCCWREDQVGCPPRSGGASSDELPSEIEKAFLRVLHSVLLMDKEASWYLDQNWTFVCESFWPSS